MQSGCLVKYDIGDIAYAEYKGSEEEFDFIANRIVKLHSVGVPYSEMAVLLRKRKISSMLAEKLEELGYGNVMHEIVKNIHKAAIAGKVIDKEDVKRMIEEVQIDIKNAAANIRRNHLPRKCDKENCSKCHFNYLCLSKAEKKAFEIG